MQKENLSFTQQKLFPLVWEGWLRSGPRSVFPGCHLEGAGSKELLSAPWLDGESWGPSASCRKSTAGLRGVSFQGGGLGARLPRAPRGAGLEAQCPGSSGSSGPGFCPPGALVPLSRVGVCPWAAGCRRGSTRVWRAQREHSAALDTRCPWIILQPRCRSLPASPCVPGCQGADEASTL